MYTEFLKICADLAVIGAAIGILLKGAYPVLKKSRTIEKNVEEIAHLKKHELNDLESLKAIRQMEREQCRVMLAMLNHMIDGNGVSEMKATRKELEKLMVDLGD